MSHIPFGYTIKEGKAVISEPEAEKVRKIFENYISGMSLTKSAELAGIKMVHSSVRRILQKNCYTGDEFYPEIIDKAIFDKANEMIKERTEQNVNYGVTLRKSPIIFKNFNMSQPKTHFDNPSEQAEYLYSLIEVKENAVK